MKWQVVEKDGEDYFLISNKDGERTEYVLDSISGDEGYTEYTVPAEVTEQYGFEYVIINDGFGRASLVHGGEFAECEKAKPVKPKKNKKGKKGDKKPKAN